MRPLNIYGTKRMNKNDIVSIIVVFLILGTIFFVVYKDKIMIRFFPPIFEPTAFDEQVSFSFDFPMEIRGDMYNFVWATQPINSGEIILDGDGAEGSHGYFRLSAQNSNQFYAETTPFWWNPSRTFDLRDSYVSFWARANISHMEEGYYPFLFVNANIDGHCQGHILFPSLKITENWTYHEVKLVNNEIYWDGYSTKLPLNLILQEAGFIGISYHNPLYEESFRNVNATGTLDIDEFKFNWEG